jgi:hypothetical protein
MNENLKDTSEDKPPFLGSWSKIYSVVLIELIILITLFYLFTKEFS